MKWLELGACLALLMPLATLLRRNPRFSLIVWMLVGFLPFVVVGFHLYMALDSTSSWTGYVKGAEISGLDIAAIALYLSLPPAQDPLPFRLAMAMYFLAAVLSAFHALIPEEALFYPWQLARMFLAYATVARGSADAQVTWAVMKGMAAGLILEAGFVIWQRFGLHAIQASGTMESQNLLGLMSHFVVLPFFALLLAGRRGPLPAVAVVAGLVVDVSTASRGTIGLAAVGLATIFVFSAAGRWTSRKGRMLIAGTAALAILTPLAAASLQDRFAKDPQGAVADYDERAVYKAAAIKMLSDHPFGIGANHFAVTGNVDGYYQGAGVGEYTLGRAGNVHNIYYLTAAETGYLGLVTLLILLSRPMIVAFRCGRRNLDDDRGNLLIGFGTALLVVYLHSWFEWILVTFSPQYLLAITIGMVAGNAQQLGYWRSARPTIAPGEHYAPANLPTSK